MQHHSEVIIIGGGLAGLTAAIHLAKYGKQVTLIEPQCYPKHKVCGEYISNEVLPYFQFLDIPIASLNPSRITQLVMSTQEGKTLQSQLPLGGFGLSRYTLDHALYNIAIQNKVQVIKDKAVGIGKLNDKFKVKTSCNTSFIGTYVIGAYGKQSKLDTLLDRKFETTASWLAVKRHYKSSWETNTVALHNFEGGYCGISAVENATVNVCYLVHYDSFKRFKNIDTFQEKILYQNPYLKDFFATATSLFEAPSTISHINFAKKNTVDQEIFMIGDSAGLIHPLCGNGMAMAIQSAQILCTLLLSNMNSSTPKTHTQLMEMYTEQWNAAFGKRMRAGRVLQKVITHKRLQTLAYYIGNTMPTMVPKLIQQTHGTPIVC